MDNNLDKAMEDYEFFLATGGEFHSTEELESWLEGAEEDSVEQQCCEEYPDYDEVYQAYEEYYYEQRTLSPAEEEEFAKQLLGELPIKCGNKMWLVHSLYMSDFHLSNNFKSLYPKAWDIYCAYIDML